MVRKCEEMWEKFPGFLAAAVLGLLVFHAGLSSELEYSSKPVPGQMPRNLSVVEIGNGSYVIKWQAPLNSSEPVLSYEIRYRTVGTWRTLNKSPIVPGETHYLLQHLTPTRKYYFKVIAHSEKLHISSKVVKYTAPSKLYNTGTKS